MESEVHDHMYWEYGNQLILEASTMNWTPPYDGCGSREEQEELAERLAWRNTMEIVLGLSIDCEPVSEGHHEMSSVEGFVGDET